VLSIAASFIVPSLPVKRAEQNEDSNDYYYDRPKDIPEVNDESTRFQKQTKPYNYNYGAKNYACNQASIWQAEAFPFHPSIMLSFASRILLTY
jgi:hypothetical protein